MRIVFVAAHICLRASNPNVKRTAVHPRSGNVPAGDLVGMDDRLSTGCWRSGTLVFRRLPGNRRGPVRAEDVLSLAEERDPR